MLPKLKFVCEQHATTLGGFARLLAEVQADVDRNLSLLEHVGNEPTGMYLFDLSDMYCSEGETYYPPRCVGTWCIQAFHDGAITIKA